MTRWTRLPERTVLAVDGGEAKKLLQGLVSNDLDRLNDQRAVYAALLTPQGKYLFDFLIVGDGDTLLLDVEAARLDDLVRRLSLYRLRADVRFTPRPDLAVFALFDGETDTVPKALVDVVDPRHPALGRRLFGAPHEVEPALDAIAEATTPEHYDRHRLVLGIPDGSRDLEPEKALLLENGFVELGGVDFTKGCFVGQELTARMRYRGTVRKRLVPVRLTGAAEPGAVIRDGEVEVGELRSLRDGVGLALIRLDRWDKAREAGRVLQTDTASVEPTVPDWLDLDFASKRAENSA